MPLALRFELFADHMLQKEAQQDKMRLKEKLTKSQDYGVKNEQSLESVPITIVFSTFLWPLKKTQDKGGTVPCFWTTEVQQLNKNDNHKDN